MTFNKKHIALFILPFFLTACSKDFFFGEKGGADAYRIGSLEPLKMPSNYNGDLPQPKEEKAYAVKPSKVLKASELLGVHTVKLSDNSVADTILKGQKTENVDFDKFDAEMHATYIAEEKERQNTVMDTLFGRDEAPIDPVLNTKEEGGNSIFSF